MKPTLLKKTWLCNHRYASPAVKPRTQSNIYFFPETSKTRSEEFLFALNIALKQIPNQLGNKKKCYKIHHRLIFLGARYQVNP